MGQVFGTDQSPVTACYPLEGDNVKATIYYRGVETGNWSMRGRTSEEAEANNPGILERVRSIAELHHCPTFAPHPTDCNAEIVDEDANWARWTDLFYRGPRADGVRLTNRYTTACAIASADCPTLVVTDPVSGHVFVAHAGLKSLIDRAHVIAGTAPRRHASVVDAIFDRLLSKPKPNTYPLPKAFIACGIGPRGFTYPTHDERYARENRALLAHIRDCWGSSCLPGDPEEGQIWLSELIRLQLVAQGLPSWCIASDAVDTYNDRDREGNFTWWSERGVRNRFGTRRIVPGARSLILVVNERP